MEGIGTKNIMGMVILVVLVAVGVLVANWWTKRNPTA